LLFVQYTVIIAVNALKELEEATEKFFVLFELKLQYDELEL